MYYYTANCPNCGKHLERLKPAFSSRVARLLDSAVRICPFCRQPYLTGKKWWGIMTKQERRNFTIKYFLSMPFLAFGAGLVIAVFFVMITAILSIELSKRGENIGSPLLLERRDF
jgi:hypothetical protein